MLGYYSNTVQMLMSILDSDGVKQRIEHISKRRVYQNKLSGMIHTYLCVYSCTYCNSRDRIMFGTLMVTTG